MKLRQSDNTFVIRLERGEELVSSLVNFAKEQGVQAAFFYGIGAVEAAEIAWYDLLNKTYQPQTFNELMEITNVTGSIAILEGEPVVHAHITLSNQAFEARGGHLNKATVGGTAEIWLTLIDKPLKRVKDEAIGLNLLDL